MSAVLSEYLDVPSPGGVVRALVARPKSSVESLPGVIAWSDIFQLTPSHVRMVRRLAGHGFFVVAPEIYSRLEPAGTVFDFDRDRQRALDAAEKTQLAWVDEAQQAVLSWVVSRPDVQSARIGACGWCFGGHVAFRAALHPRVKATACFYATGVHNGTLGAARGDAGTIERSPEIHGSLLLVWGREDPHIPAEGRLKIHQALESAGVQYESRSYDAEHAFMRDEGPRYDPESADRAFSEMIDLFRRHLGVLRT
ncbi:MAG: dienelactone hydrolase family protein [Deltaproteobacteria bacterium]|nr:dienelactone hydrolase family protein [Deltaproteobacteria bacterium]